MIAAKKKKCLNIKEFARIAGVSPATASRVFAANPLVKPETAERVKKLAEEYNFRPNHVASSAFNGKTKSIGVLLCNLRTTYFADIAHGIQQVLIGKDYLPIMISLRNENDYQAIQRLVNHRVDGIIACLSEQSLSVNQVEELNYFEVPMVTIEYCSQKLNCDNVQSDERACGRIAAEYLLKHNHRKMAVLCGSIAKNLPRIDSFLETLAGQGCAVPFENRVQFNLMNTPWKQAVDELAGWLEKHPEVTAFYAYNDNDAMLLYQAAGKIGRRIPEDLSVIGSADLQFSANVSPELTTIRQDGEKNGQIAAKMILERLESPSLPCRQIITQVELVERKSVKELK